MDEIVRAIDPISGVGIVDGTGRGGAVPMDRVRGPKSGRDGWGVRSFTSYVHQTTCLQSIRISWFGTTESSALQWGMDLEHHDPTDWREWRRMRAWRLRLKQLGWKQRDIATALDVSGAAVTGIPQVSLPLARGTHFLMLS